MANESKKKMVSEKDLCRLLFIIKLVIILLVDRDDWTGRISFCRGRVRDKWSSETELCIVHGYVQKEVRWNALNAGLALKSARSYTILVVWEGWNAQVVALYYM